MKAKYIDDRYGPFIGMSCVDGKVCVTDADDSFSVFMDKSDAAAVIHAANRLQAKLVECALRFAEVCPDEFDKYWYGTN